MRCFISPTIFFPSFCKRQNNAKTCQSLHFVHFDREEKLHFQWQIYDLSHDIQVFQRNALSITSTNDKIPGFTSQKDRLPDRTDITVLFFQQLLPFKGQTKLMHVANGPSSLPSSTCEIFLSSCWHPHRTYKQHQQTEYRNVEPVICGTFVWRFDWPQQSTDTRTYLSSRAVHLGKDNH